MAIGTAAALVAVAAASGNFQVPVVAGDHAAGLSADGSTAVLLERPAAGRTRFALIDRRERRLERVITLRGDLGFDAMSPDGSKLYVIRYLSADHRRYAVQALETDEETPSLTTVVEKGEPGEKMAGSPVGRVTGGDGDWVYTLYDGAAGEPFIHALDTTEQFTVCIDLDALEGRSDIDHLGISLDPSGRTIVVRDPKHKPLVSVDTGSFDVTTAKTTSTSDAGPTNPDEGPPWKPIGALAATALLTAAAIEAGRRRRSASI